jgi:hypothetical protein
MKKISIIFCLAIVSLLIISCAGKEYPLVSRESKLPSDVVKMTPETDIYPPVLHSAEFRQPVPLPGPVNTNGGEDSPFIPIFIHANDADEEELYFFFTPDVRIPAEKQLLDGVTGIYVSKRVGGAWQVPQRVVLQDKNKLSLDGCEFVHNNFMLFCSAREGYTGIHWFSAQYNPEKKRWQNWKPADFPAEYNVGELHIYEDSSKGLKELYYHSDKSYYIAGKGQNDIWMLTWSEEQKQWTNPINIEAVNTAENEGMPYITKDGTELWFHRWYKGSPAIFRSVREKTSAEAAGDATSGNAGGFGEWQKPEMIVSQFAGEPTLDSEGNLYFVHHYYKDSKMIEADIYFAEKK